MIPADRPGVPAASAATAAATTTATGASLDTAGDIAGRDQPAAQFGTTPPPSAAQLPVAPRTTPYVPAEQPLPMSVLSRSLVPADRTTSGASAAAPFVAQRPPDAAHSSVPLTHQPPQPAAPPVLMPPPSPPCMRAPPLVPQQKEEEEQEQPPPPQQLQQQQPVPPLLTSESRFTQPAARPAPSLASTQIVNSQPSQQPSPSPSLPLRLQAQAQPQLQLQPQPQPQLQLQPQPQREPIAQPKAREPQPHAREPQARQPQPQGQTQASPLPQPPAQSPPPVPCVHYPSACACVYFPQSRVPPALGATPSTATPPSSTTYVAATAADATPTAIPAAAPPATAPGVSPKRGKGCPTCRRGPGSCRAIGQPGHLIDGARPVEGVTNRDGRPQGARRPSASASTSAGTLASASGVVNSPHHPNYRHQSLKRRRVDSDRTAHAPALIPPSPHLQHASGGNMHGGGRPGSSGSVDQCCRGHPGCRGGHSREHSAACKRGDRGPGKVAAASRALNTRMGAGTLVLGDGSGAAAAALAAQPVPVVTVDVRARQRKSLMQIVAEQELDPTTIQAGAFVVRVTPFVGLDSNELIKIAHQAPHWSLQQWGARAQGVYMMSVKPAAKAPSPSSLNPMEFITEEGYWDNLRRPKSGNQQRPALYAHDFDASGANAIHTKLLPSGWDLEDLGPPNLLKKVLPLSCPGITTTYGYLGNPGSTFAYHVEDACLGSMNVNLGGGAKMWYTMPRSARDPFEAGLKQFFPKEFKRCASFSQHKVCVVHPQAAEAMAAAPLPDDVPIGFALGHTRALHKHAQLPGDLVVTLPGSYHSGFSTQMNYGEATNYATERWLESFEAPPISLCYKHNESTLTFNQNQWRTLQTQLCSIVPKFN